MKTELQQKTDSEMWSLLWAIEARLRKTTETDYEGIAKLAGSLSRKAKKQSERVQG